VSLLTFAGGSLTSLFGGAIYALCPVSPGNQQVQQAWLTFVMTMGTFGTDALFTSLRAENWRVLRQRASPRMVALLLVPSALDPNPSPDPDPDPDPNPDPSPNQMPSALDVLITGAATVALSLAPPSLVRARVMGMVMGLGLGLGSATPNPNPHPHPHPTRTPTPQPTSQATSDTHTR
jgi:hypothetical protein